jgi:hypothetical protein
MGEAAARAERAAKRSVFVYILVVCWVFAVFWESCRLRRGFLVFFLFEAKVEWRIRVCCGWY